MVCSKFDARYHKLFLDFGQIGNFLFPWVSIIDIYFMLLLCIVLWKHKALRTCMTKLFTEGIKHSTSISMSALTIDEWFFSCKFFLLRHRTSEEPKYEGRDTKSIFFDKMCFVIILIILMWLQANYKTFIYIWLDLICWIRRFLDIFYLKKHFHC